MGRHAKPWERTGRSGWWTKRAGRFVRLGDTEREAWAELHRLEAQGSGSLPAGRLTVPELVDLWLDARQGEVSEATWRNNQIYGQSLARHCARIKARDLKPLHLRSWLKSHPEWVGCRGLAVQVAKQVTRWARREGWLDADPLQDAQGIAIRSREPAPAESIERLPDGIRSEEFRSILVFLLATGCRPGEARTLEASQIDLGSRLASVRGKSGLRLVILPESLTEALRPLLASRPSGPVFRNTRGEPWSAKALSEQFRRSRKRAGVSGVVPYSCRGTFASRAHKAGVDSATIASLLGHKDVGRLAILIRHYLSIDEGTLRDGVDKAQK